MTRIVIGALFLVGLTSLASLAGAQATGTIRGTVLDEKGKPVAQATVTVFQADVAAPVERSVSSSADGAFTFSGLTWGKYQVASEKPEDGYPDTSAEFYGKQPATTPVVLDRNHPSATVKIGFRFKASMLTGTVVNEETHQPIRSTFLVRRVDDPAKLITVDQPSAYRILIPADTDVTLEVSSPQHKTWYYPGTNDVTKRKPLRLNKGQDRKLNIQLDGDSQDCACLDRPQLRGLGADSPAFQIHGPDGLSSETLRCNKTDARIQPLSPQAESHVHNR